MSNIHNVLSILNIAGVTAIGFVFSDDVVASYTRYKATVDWLAAESDAGRGDQYFGDYDSFPENVNNLPWCKFEDDSLEEIQDHLTSLYDSIISSAVQTGLITRKQLDDVMRHDA